MDNVEVLKKEIEKKPRISSRIYHKKSDGEKRSIVVRMYVNEEEKRQLDKDAKMVSKDLSTFCRELYLDKKMITSKDSQRWGILSKLGRQFIKFKNEVKREKVDDDKMIGLLNDILSEIKLLREELLK
jgi:hypothetical protein